MMMDESVVEVKILQRMVLDPNGINLRSQLGSDEVLILSSEKLKMRSEQSLPKPHGIALETQGGAGVFSTRFLWRPMTKDV